MTTAIVAISVVAVLTSIASMCALSLVSSHASRNLEVVVRDARVDRERSDSQLAEVLNRLMARDFGEWQQHHFADKVSGSFEEPDEDDRQTVQLWSPEPVGNEVTAPRVPHFAEFDE